MKIGIDIDNTITDTLPLLKKYCEKRGLMVQYFLK